MGGTNQSKSSPARGDQINKNAAHGQVCETTSAASKDSETTCSTDRAVNDRIKNQAQSAAIEVEGQGQTVKIQVQDQAHQESCPQMPSVANIIMQEYQNLKVNINEVLKGYREIQESMQLLEGGALHREQLMSDRLQSADNVLGAEIGEPDGDRKEEFANQTQVFQGLMESAETLRKNLEILSTKLKTSGSRQSSLTPGELSLAKSDLPVEVLSTDCAKGQTDVQTVSLETETKPQLDCEGHKRCISPVQRSIPDLSGKDKSEIKSKPREQLMSEAETQSSIAAGNQSHYVQGKGMNTEPTETLSLPGFCEQFDLSENQMELGRCLRRQRTNLRQDNRLVEMLGLTSNHGAVYQSCYRQSEENFKTEHMSSSIFGSTSDGVVDKMMQMNPETKSVNFALPEGIVAEAIVKERASVTFVTGNGMKRHLDLDAEVAEDMSKLLEEFQHRQVVALSQLDLRKSMEVHLQFFQKLNNFMIEHPEVAPIFDEVLKRMQQETALPEGLKELLQRLDGGSSNFVDSWTSALSSVEKVSNLLGEQHEETKPAPDPQSEPLFRLKEPPEVTERSNTRSVTSTSVTSVGRTFDTSPTTAATGVDTSSKSTGLEQAADTGGARTIPVISLARTRTATSTDVPDTSRSDIAVSTGGSSKRAEMGAPNTGTATGTNLTSVPERTDIVRSTVSVKPFEHNQRTDDMLLSDEPVVVDEAVWADAVNKEIKNGQICRDIREKGVDTIICLDISDSMKGTAWTQAMNFVRGFVEKIQSTTVLDDVFEHLAIVTFGHETKVQQHMTCDYIEVLRKLDRLRPGGPSPMFAGIMMCYAAMVGAGTVFVANGMKLHPRVLLVTDGNVTPGQVIAGPDTCSDIQKVLEHEKILGSTLKVHMEFNWTFYPVPVGEFDVSLLEKIAKGTNGRVVSPEDWVRVSHYMPNALHASKLIALGGLGETGLLDALLDGIDDLDKEDILHFLTISKEDRGNDSDDENDSKLPPVGTRVRRGKDWRWGNQDLNGVGTVVGQTKRFKNWVDVIWDHKGVEEGIASRSYRYRYGADGGKYDLVIVDEPRVLGPDELIDVGCVVRRGKDWSYSDQDGGVGNLGVVYFVVQTGFVKVRWENGHKNNYKFGAEGLFDVEVVHPDDTGRRNVKRNEVEEMNRKNAMMSIEQMSDQPATEGATGGARETTVGRTERSKNKNQLRLERAETGGMSGSEMKAADDIMNEMNLKNSGNLVSSDQYVNAATGSLDTSLSESDHSVTTLECSENDRMNRLNMRNAGDSTGVVIQTGSHEPVLSRSVMADSQVHVAVEDHLDKQNRRNVTESGAVPKKISQQASAVLSGSGSTSFAVWQWRTQDGNWREYSSDVSQKIERSFHKNSKIVLVQESGEQYRIVFSRMQQINVITKETAEIQRLALA